MQWVSSACAHDLYYMAANDFDTLCWNVRGLNSAKRCLAVHEMIASTSCHIACLQETKLQSLDSTLARFLGAYKLNQFTFKPAQGTKGGILILWNDSTLDLQNIQIQRYSITATVTALQRCLLHAHNYLRSFTSGGKRKLLATFKTNQTYARHQMDSYGRF